METVTGKQLLEDIKFVIKRCQEQDEYLLKAGANQNYSEEKRVKVLSSAKAQLDFFEKRYIELLQKQNGVIELLDRMLESDKELYEKILDTPGFSYYFNELVKLAQKVS